MSYYRKIVEGCCNKPCDCKNCKWWFAEVLRWRGMECGLKDFGKCTAPLCFVLTAQDGKVEKKENDRITTTVSIDDILSNLEQRAFCLSSNDAQTLRDAYILLADEEEAQHSIMEPFFDLSKYVTTEFNGDILGIEKIKQEATNDN